MEKIKATIDSLGKVENGWRVATSAFGDRNMYAGNFARRAAAPMAGIYGNDATEALYPMLVTDSAGKKPDISVNRYILTFAPSKLTPGQGVLAVTMYDGKSQLLISNPINRYLINSPMLPELKKNADGSLSLLIQKGSPGKDKESNWLPAPDGLAYIVMRIYWPEASALKGTWQPPVVQPAK
jgi:hypothetical protein